MHPIPSPPQLHVIGQFAPLYFAYSTVFFSYTCIPCILCYLYVFIVIVFLVIGAQLVAICNAVCNPIKINYVYAKKTLLAQPKPVLLLNNVPLKQVQQECYLAMVTSNI